MDDEKQEKPFEPVEDKSVNDGFGHTDWVIPEGRKFDLNDHVWTQYGNEIVCSSCEKKHGSIIPVDKVLIQGEKGYELVDVPVLK